MDRRDWWKEAVVYQIYPKSFQDSNGDGVGDIRGIISRLDYLKELGVNVIWMCPVYCSPMDDGGYDISDYDHIHPMFGRDADMDELIEKAKERGIRILMDLVINHTSDEHEWFKKALSDPGSKYADYYIFKETGDGSPPNNWRSYFGGSAWERVEGTNRYYLHAFSKKQPDLNWENKELREELYASVNRWLEKGLGGFRIDAICNIKKRIEYGIFKPDGDDGLRYIGDWILNQPGIELFLKELNEKTFRPHNSMTVAEADVPDELLGKFIGEEGFFSMVFDFSYTDIDVPATGEWFRPRAFTVDELKQKLFLSQERVQKNGWGAVYLENHDQYRSPDKYLRKEDINDHSKKMLASLFMCLRGTPFLYQGQEIGMENIRLESIEQYDDIATRGQYERALAAGFTDQQAYEFVVKRSRDNSRTPMQWSAGKNAGFSSADETWMPVNQNYGSLNADLQRADEDSVLCFYKKLIALRKSNTYGKILTYGSFVPYETGNKNVIAYGRCLCGKKLIAVHNFSNQSEAVQIPAEYGNIVLSNYNQSEIENCRLILKPFECVLIEYA